MNKKEKKIFPKGFFTKSRKTMTMEDALKDIVPFKWSKEVIAGEKEAIICSTNKKTM